MAKPNVRDFQGALPVDGKVTPVSREPIEDVDASQWNTLPTMKLQQQMVILNKRLQAAHCSSNLDIIKQLEKGIARLQFIINERDEDTKLI